MTAFPSIWQSPENYPKIKVLEWENGIVFRLFLQPLMDSSPTHRGDSPFMAGKCEAILLIMIASWVDVSPLSHWT